MTPRRLILSFLIVGATACGSSAPSDSGAGSDVTPAPATSPAPDAATTDPAAATTDPAGTSTDPVGTTDNPTITIADSRFDQLELRVPAGTTVVFVNTDNYNHTITSAEGSPVEYDSGKFGEGETFEFTFDEPGEYPYFCQVHPTMRATIIVE